MRRSFFLMVLLATACNENEFKRASNTEEFLQAPSNQVDILWVIDNSCSMYDEQARLIQNMSRFIGYADSLGSDYQMAVTVTDSTDLTPVSPTCSGSRMRRLASRNDVAPNATSGVTREPVPAWLV